MPTLSEGYRVQLDVFTGPLDLLLYLIRRDEVDIYDIPVAQIAAAYSEHVALLEQLDPDAVSDFLVLAATLVELKSRALLPTPPIENIEESDDPRAPLVKQLLEYKRFKDASQSLGRAADDRAKRYVRKPVDLPPDLQGVELEEVEVWDLLKAFGQVMSAIGRGPGRAEITYDDTPVELHAAEIVAILEREGPTSFQQLFDGQMERIQIVGRFLALLELIRQHKLRAEQEKSFGTIYLFLLEEVPELPEDAFEDEATAPETPPDVAESSDANAGAEAPPDSSVAPDTPVSTPTPSVTDARPDMEKPNEQAQ